MKFRKGTLISLTGDVDSDQIWNDGFLRREETQGPEKTLKQGNKVMTN